MLKHLLFPPPAKTTFYISISIQVKQHIQEYLIPELQSFGYRGNWEPKIKGKIHYIFQTTYSMLNRIDL
jgi:hypothetical protein